VDFENNALGWSCCALLRLTARHSIGAESSPDHAIIWGLICSVDLEVRRTAMFYADNFDRRVKNFYFLESLRLYIQTVLLPPQVIPLSLDPISNGLPSQMSKS